MEFPEPMTDARLEEIRNGVHPKGQTYVNHSDDKEELLREVDRLKRLVAQQQGELNEFRKVRGSVAKSLREARADIDNLNVAYQNHREAARQRELARRERMALAEADAVQNEVLPPEAEPVLWLFRAGSGHVYASRQKPEPQVLAGVLAWTVDGDICPVSLPLRNWVEPGQRIALGALPIGGDA